MNSTRQWSQSQPSSLSLNRCNVEVSPDWCDALLTERAIVVEYPENIEFLGERITNTLEAITNASTYTPVHKVNVISSAGARCTNAAIIDNQFLILDSGKSNTTSSSIRHMTDTDIAKAYLADYYHERYPYIISEIKDRLLQIGLRKEDWDGKGSAMPNQHSLSRAHNLIESFLKTIVDGGYVWKNPFISSDEDGDVTFEWHKGEYELHIDVSENSAEYIKVWGTNIEHEMYVGKFSQSSFLLLWNWLIHG